MARSVGRPIALRLVLAFLGVAAVAVLIVTVLTVLMGHQSIGDLRQERRDSLVASISAVAASSYNTGAPGWSDVDLQPAEALAEISGARLVVLDGAGHVVVSTLTVPANGADLITRPIMVNGSPVGTVQVQFVDRRLVVAADNLQAAAIEAVLGATGVAALVALVVALVVARHFTSPVTRLVEWSLAVSQGDRDARVGELRHAPVELIGLGATLDKMSDALTSEEQLRREQAADIAHELRRPITVLQATCEALTDGVLPFDQEQVVSLREEVLQLASIVEDVQTLTDEDAPPRSALRTCDLATIAESVATAWAASFTAAKLEFDWQLSPALIQVDPRRLHQVIANLLSNAMKFTPAGGQVQMNLIACSGQARLSVSDTGAGLDPEDRAHLYQRRWRGASSRGVQGSGLGLAVAAELMRAQGGHLEVASEPGRGSTFTIVMPLAPGPDL